MLEALKKGDRGTMDRGSFNDSEFHRMSRAGSEFVTQYSRVFEKKV
jgi:hypothetical protein